MNFDNIEAQRIAAAEIHALAMKGAQEMIKDIKDRQWEIPVVSKEIESDQQPINP